MKLITTLKLLITIKTIIPIESAIKSISQSRTIRNLYNGLDQILRSIPVIYAFKPLSETAHEVLQCLLPIVNSQNAFIYIQGTSSGKSIFKGVGIFSSAASFEAFETLEGSSEIKERIQDCKQSRGHQKTKRGVLMPLADSDNFKGVIYVESEKFSEYANLLESYASQVTHALVTLSAYSAILVEK